MATWNKQKFKFNFFYLGSYFFFQNKNLTKVSSYG
jgi:hypothetical protein